MMVVLFLKLGRMNQGGGQTTMSQPIVFCAKSTIEDANGLVVVGFDQPRMAESGNQPCDLRQLMFNRGSATS